MNHEKRKQIQSGEVNSYKSTITPDEDVMRLNMDYVQSPSVEECKSMIHLKGPFSPLEMKIYSYTEYGAGKTITIDGQSVNSAMLDSNPDDSFDRYVNKRL